MGLALAWPILLLPSSTAAFLLSDLSTGRHRGLGFTKGELWGCPGRSPSDVYSHLIQLPFCISDVCTVCVSSCRRTFWMVWAKPWPVIGCLCPRISKPGILATLLRSPWTRSHEGSFWSLPGLLHGQGPHGRQLRGPQARSSWELWTSASLRSLWELYLLCTVIRDSKDGRTPSQRTVPYGIAHLPAE